MIGYLRGNIKCFMNGYCLLDVNGVGYRVFITESARGKLAMGSEAEFYVHTSVREDAIQLYGFLSQHEYNLFQQLISVSGVGPKVAMGILSSITVEALCIAIRQKQSSVLTKLPGIGKKSAERLILELKDKLSADLGEMDIFSNENPDDILPGSSESEAVDALLSLGYSQQEIIPVLRKAGNITDTQELIKFALREFAGGK